MVDTPIGNLVVKLNYNGEAFERGITQAERQLKTFGRTAMSSVRYAKDHNYEMEASKTAIHNMKTQYKGLNQTLDHHVKNLEKMKAEGKELTPEYANREKRIASLREQMMSLTSEYDKFTKTLSVKNSPFTKIGDVMESVGGKMQNFGRGLNQTGQGFLQAGMVATIGASAFIGKAMEFERGMVQVKKTTGASAGQMKIFEDQIRSMAKEMPIAVGELSELASIAGQLGVKQEDLSSFTETMAKIGTATTLSSQQASEAIARFTNVSGTGTKTIENIGSALVEMGNNLATTETEIMDMSSLLVGTLTTLGVAEQDILGLSGAMSSLGITAERGGGSISKFFVDMSTAVSDGGDKLAQFSKVAGMTNDEFSKLFQQDSMGAFQSFIDGLAEIQASGGDVIKTLDDMGIKEIRLRDTILKLVGGHEKLNEALNLSSSAYKDATALDREYKTQLESTSAQWEIAKNKIADVAISLGQALLPAVIDLLDQSSGLIEMAQDFADWFSELDDGTKSSIISMGAWTLVLGSTLSPLGKMIEGGGTLITTIGSLSKGIGGLSKFKGGSIADLAKHMTTFGKETVTATTATGLFSTGLGTAVAGLGVLSGALMLGYGYYQILNGEARKAHDAMIQFPDISGITSKQADSLNKVTDAFIDLELFGGSSAESSVQDSETIKSSVDTIVGEIERLNKQKLDELNEEFKELPANVQQTLKEAMGATQENIDEQVNRAKEVQAEIDKIYQDADEKNRELTEGEKQRLKNYETELKKAYADALGNTMEQQSQIYDNLTADLSEKSSGTLEKHRHKLQDYLKAEEEAFVKQKQILQENFDAGNINQLEYDKAYAQLVEGHTGAINKATDALIKVMAEQGKRAGIEGEELYKAIADQLGIAPEVVKKTLEKSTKDTETALKNLFAVLEDTDVPTSKAMDNWNKGIESFAKNMGKSIEQLSTEDLKTFAKNIEDYGVTWNELELLSKDANIDSNVKKVIDEALSKISEWDKMTPEERFLKIGVKGQEELDALMTKINVDWATLEPAVKELSTTYDGGELIEEALRQIDRWNALEPAQKQAILETQIDNTEVERTITNMDLWNNQEFVEKYASINTNAPEAEQQMHDLLVAWGVIPKEDTRKLITESNIQETKESAEGLVGVWTGRILTSLFPAKANVDTNAKETKESLEGASTAHDKLRENGSKPANAQTKSNAKDTKKQLDNANKSMTTTREGFSKGATATLKANDTDALKKMQGVRDALNKLNGTSVTTYIDVVKRPSGSRYATGTGFHVGGLAVLGDGGRQEPFLTPDGRFGVSPNKDTMYDLPIGTKVWSSIAQFKKQASDNPLLKSILERMPHFADGTSKSFLDDFAKFSIPFDIDSFSIKKGLDKTDKQEITDSVVDRLLTYMSVRDNQLTDMTMDMIRLLQVISNKDTDLLINDKSVVQETFDYSNEYTKRKNIQSKRLRGGY